MLSVGDVIYDNKKNEVKLNFANSEIHGNIDGGHTYKIILDAKRNGQIYGQHYVMIEVVKGVEDFIEILAESRNTSHPVDLKSIEELKKNFEPIKEMLQNSSFINRIAFNPFYQ